MLLKLTMPDVGMIRIDAILVASSLGIVPKQDYWQNTTLICAVWKQRWMLLLLSGRINLQPPNKQQIPSVNHVWKFGWTCLSSREILIKG
jgi:hypothetical protein